MDHRPWRGSWRFRGLQWRRIGIDVLLLDVNRDTEIYNILTLFCRLRTFDAVRSIWYLHSKHNIFTCRDIKLDGSWILQVLGCQMTFETFHRSLPAPPMIGEGSKISPWQAYQLWHALLKRVCAWHSSQGKHHPCGTLVLCEFVLLFHIVSKPAAQAGSFLPLKRG